MKMAMDGLDQPVDYINTHGTSTPIGDTKELEALRQVFEARNRIPAFNSTKSLTGHALGAAGAHEAIYSLLMMENDFICVSANIDELDPAADDMPIVLERQDDAGSAACSPTASASAAPTRRWSSSASTGSSDIQAPPPPPRLDLNGMAKGSVFFLSASVPRCLCGSPSTRPPPFSAGGCRL